MLIFSGVCAIANGINSCQCFGRVSRPAASSLLYRGVAGSGVINPKIGSPGGQVRISFSVRSATPGVSLSMPKIKEVMAKTLRWASRSSTTPYSPGLLKPFFTSARLAGSMDSIPMKINLLLIAQQIGADLGDPMHLRVSGNDVSQQRFCALYVDGKIVIDEKYGNLAALLLC